MCTSVIDNTILYIDEDQYTIEKTSDGVLIKGRLGSFDVNLPDGITLTVGSLHRLIIDKLNGVENNCTHPNSYYDGEEESLNCKKQKIMRDRWRCPDCGAIWYEGMSVWDDRLQRFVMSQG